MSTGKERQTDDRETPEEKLTGNLFRPIQNQWTGNNTNCSGVSFAANCSKRMKEIIEMLKVPHHELVAKGIANKELEGLFEELHRCVSSSDMANDMLSNDGLAPLLQYLKHSKAGIRAKSIAILNSIVSNNFKAKSFVMESTPIGLLLSIISFDPDTVVCQQALNAIYSLTVSYETGAAAFRIANGYTVLRYTLNSEDAMIQSTTLLLVHKLIEDDNSNCSIVSELGFPAAMAHFVSSNDFYVRKHTLRCLLELSQDHIHGGATSLGKLNGLREILGSRIDVICSSISGLRLCRATWEERQMLDLIWVECFAESSPLTTRGVLLLPGEDSRRPLSHMVGKLTAPEIVRWMDMYRTSIQAEHDPAYDFLSVRSRETN